MESDLNIGEITEEIWDIQDGFTIPKLVNIIVSMYYVFNLVFVFMPWVFISEGLILYNVIFNSWLNKGWAEGNFWLVGNTVFAFVQTILSWPLVAEW